MFSNLSGRLATRTYASCFNGSRIDFTEMYSYTAAGQVRIKRMRIARSGQTTDLDGTWTYDSEGAMASVTYPVVGGETAQTYTIGYDAMKRPLSMTEGGTGQQVVSSVTYGPAGELLAVAGAYTETRTYNTRLQLTSLNGVSFNYPAAPANSGKIASQTEAVSGETITYTYDALNRLAAASSNLSWSQAYGYDGFGNLLTISGSGTPYNQPVDAATNRVLSLSFDGNGNQTVANGRALTYDVENRMVWSQQLPSGSGYGYDPDNRRVYRSKATYDGNGNWAVNSEEITYWGISGQRMTSYSLAGGGTTLTQTGNNVYFGSKLVKRNSVIVAPDRLGSIGKYYPYGEERGTATGNDADKFATYYRDADTGLDYGVNRYYGTGRFLSPDRKARSAHPESPRSWNRYTYSLGDPITFRDRLGLETECEACEPDDDDDEGQDGSVKDFV